MYVNWDERSMVALTKFKWYLVEDVLDYLHELRFYVINTPGKFSASYLPQLKDSRQREEMEPSNPLLHQIPASKILRFPNKQVFLCEAIGLWNLHLDWLQLGCNIMINTNRLERKYPDYETAGQLESYILQMINTLLQQLEAKTDFISQEVFESRYDLTWSVDQLDSNTSKE